jgi:hypothetical protein
MVAIHLNANCIFVKPMCSRSKEEMIQAYENIINRIRLAGLGLKKHTLDNQALEAFKQCIQEQQMKHKLVPPGNHQRNQAEHAIQTFKAHFTPNFSRHRGQIPTLSVVSSPQTNRTYPELTAPIEGSTQDISLCTRPRTTRLHEKTVCTSRLRNTSPRQTRGPPHMGHMI